MSRFTERFRCVAAPRLMETFAERDADGNIVGVKYWLPSHPDGVEPLKFPGIPSSVRSEIQFTADGEVRREMKTWQIETALLAESGVLHPQRNAIVEDGDGKWAVDSTACVWGEVFVTLALSRAPRTAGNELRSASV